MTFETENQGATTDSPAVSESSVSESSSQSASQGQTQETQTVKETPFHEHPRFKELVEQKNQFATKSQNYERQLAQMQSQLREMQQVREQKREDALHSRLKGIDPEFGERFAKVDSSLAELEALKQWKQSFEMNQVRERGVNMVQNLHSENKVSPEMQNLYNAQIEMAVRGNPQLTLEDLPKVYKEVHEQFSKILEARDRSLRESYVQDKKKDASIPSSTKGKATPTTKAGFEYSKNPYEARQQVVGNILSKMKAGS